MSIFIDWTWGDINNGDVGHQVCLVGFIYYGLLL